MSRGRGGLCGSWPARCPAGLAGAAVRHAHSGASSGKRAGTTRRRGRGGARGGVRNAGGGVAVSRGRGDLRRSGPAGCRGWLERRCPERTAEPAAASGERKAKRRAWKVGGIRWVRKGATDLNRSGTGPTLAGGGEPPASNRLRDPDRPGPPGRTRRGRPRPWPPASCNFFSCPDRLQTSWGKNTVAVVGAQASGLDAAPLVKQ